ncbi:MAG: hypothetical protein ACREBR_05315 [bacterium]
MKSHEYKSSCKACAHLHQGYICNWQVHKTGRISLKPVYNGGLWGIGNALHQHIKDENSKEIDSYPAHVDIYKSEQFEYEQETDCGCKCYIPSENLEFLEWKYSQSE